MISVKQIKEWPIGHTCGAFVLTVKTVKGITPGKKTWQRAMLSDDDGDAILAELPLQGKIVQRTAALRLWAERVELELNNKMVPGLKVDRWEYVETFSEPPDQDISQAWQEDIRIIKGKVRHGIVCSLIKSPDGRPTINDETKKYINAWVDFIMTGE